MHLRSLTLGTGLALITSTLWVGATDWPQWRGPKRDDISTETGLLKAWPSGGPPLAWTAKGIGGGFSGISIAEGRIYTMGDGPEASFVHALQEADGKLLWSAKLGKPGGGGGEPGPRCTPSVDGDTVVAVNQYGDLVCLDTKDGKERWRKNYGADFAGKMMSGWGYAESPLVDGGLVICTPGGPQGTMIALDKKTGALAWRTKEWTDNAAYCSPIVVEIGGVRQFIQMTDASVAGVATDGRLLWRASRKGATAVIPTPICQDNFVYVTSSYGIGCNLLKVAAEGGKFSASQVFANKVMVNHHGGVVLVDGYLYGYSDGKGWTCQDFKTGEAVWADKKLGKGSITCANGQLYLREEGGKGPIVLIDASPKACQEHGRFEQPERSKKNSWPHPVIANGKLYIRDQDVLLCYDVRQK